MSAVSADTNVDEDSDEDNVDEDNVDTELRKEGTDDNISQGFAS